MKYEFKFRGDPNSDRPDQQTIEACCETLGRLVGSGSLPAEFIELLLKEVEKPSGDWKVTIDVLESEVERPQGRVLPPAEWYAGNWNMRIGQWLIQRSGNVGTMEIPTSSGEVVVLSNDWDDFVIQKIKS